MDHVRVQCPESANVAHIVGVNLTRHGLWHTAMSRRGPCCSGLHKVSQYITCFSNVESGTYDGLVAHGFAREDVTHNHVDKPVRFENADEIRYGMTIVTFRYEVSRLPPAKQLSPVNTNGVNRVAFIDQIPPHSLVLSETHLRKHALAPCSSECTPIGRNVDLLQRTRF